MRTDSAALTVPVTQTPPAETVPERVTSSGLRGFAILGALLFLTVLLQILSGAYRAEFSAYPDEPAHYVTSLMVREYITGPHPFSPLAFAEQYYHHYPKVAIGHWPPFFYLVQALWMLLFSAARASVRLEIAFTTAILGFSFWQEARRWFGNAPAILGAALLICLPLVQDSTDQEMAETLLALCCYWCVIYFGRFLDSQKRSDSLLFGLWFALAVLTKGSGWLLALVPCIGFLLTRKVRVVFTREFWFGLLLAAALCVPWQLATFQSAQRGWAGGAHPTAAYTVSALFQFFSITVDIVGPVLATIAGLGIVITVLIPLFRKPVRTTPAIMLGLLIADLIFHSVVPAGVEDRKMIMAVPAILYFLFTGGLWLADIVPAPSHFARWKRPALAALAAVLFFSTVFRIPRDSHYGYAEAARFLVSDPSLRSASILVSSGSIGEGLLISEVAILQPRPHDVILRATKELAHVDWAGGHYESLYHDTPSLRRYLEQANISSVVVDTYHGSGSFPHEILVKRALKEKTGKFRLRAEFAGRSDSGEPGKVQIYERTAP